MGDSQRKLKDRASRAYADGKLKDALKMYRQVVDEDPTETQCQLKVGDIHRKLGEREEAVVAYIPVAQTYANDGLVLKAIAVCKMILAVDSNHQEGRALLADLYARRHGTSATPMPPVTLQGMGISPPPGQSTQPSMHEYGMVELDPGPAAEISPADESMSGSWPGSMRTLEPGDIGGAVEVPVDLRPDPAVAPVPAATPSASPSAGATMPISNMSGVIPVVTGTPDAPPPARPVSSPVSPELVVGQKLQAPLASTEIAPTDEVTVEASSLGQEVTVHQPVNEADLAAIQGEQTVQTPVDEATLAAMQGDQTVPAPVDPAALESMRGERTVQAPVDPSLLVQSALIHADGPPPETSETPIALTDVVRLSAEESEIIELTNPVSSPAQAPLTASAPSELSIPMEPAVEAPPHHQAATSVPEAAESLEDLGRTSIPLFSDLPKNAFIELLVEMDMHQLEPGDPVIEEGQEGDSFFVLVTGKVRVQHKDRMGKDVVLAHLSDGAFFGEMALLQDGARTATVLAETECQIFEIRREVLDRVVERYPSVASVLKNFYKQRLLSTTMATHPIFRPFNPDERRRLMELFRSRSFAKGDILLQEGKKGTGLFLLLYGTLEVVKNREGEEVVLAELGSGDLFGEMSLLTNQPTVATIRAVTDCFVMRMSKRKFDEVIMTHPQILELVGTISEERAEQNEVVLRSSSPLGTGMVLV